MGWRCTDGGWSLYQYISRLARKRYPSGSVQALIIWISGWWFFATPPKNMSSSFGMMKFPIYLVVSIPLKNMSSSVGMIILPNISIYGKSFKIPWFQSPPVPDIDVGHPSRPKRYQISGFQLILQSKDVQSDVASGYDIHSLPWKDPPIFKNGKPSISIRATA